MIPAPYRLPVKRYVAGEPDRYGDVQPSWEPGEIAAHAVAPGAMVELPDPTRNAEEVAFTVYATPGTHVGSQDLVEVDGEDYEVIGNIKDWSRGPWRQGNAGVVIELKRREG